MNEDWEIQASPRFTKAYCPKHSNSMIQLENGWFGNPVWWCGECKFVYQLKFMKMREWDQKAVDKQLEAKIKSNDK